MICVEIYYDVSPDDRSIRPKLYFRFEKRGTRSY